jgi:hypothetical protein
MVEIKGIPAAMADKVKDAVKGDRDPKPTQLPADASKNRDGQKKVRLARPDEEAKIKRDRREGDWRNNAREQTGTDCCVSDKDLETHTRLARPDEEDEIKERHAKKRAEAAGQNMPPLSAKQQQAEADEAAASVARRQALGGV